MKILIVDDDPGTCHAIFVGLASMGHDVQIATSGKKALEAFVADTPRIPDLLLTDLCMPECNGFQLIRSARKIQPGLPAILMTAYGNTAVENQVKSLQPCGYIEKPFTILDLSETIQSVTAG